MDFVLVANAWDAGISNPTGKHRLARALAEQGHRILWVEGAGMRRPRLGSGTDRRRMARKVQASFRRPACVYDAERGSIHAVAPLLAPFPGWRAARVLNGWLCRVRASAAARRLGFNAPVLVNFVPVLAECMHRWPGPRIYYCVDRWDAFAMYDSRVMRAADARCCTLADRVVATSRELQTRCLRRNPRTALLPHGVDHAHFAQALDVGERPADLPEGPIAGFFGLLSEWLDQALIRALALQVRDAAVVLIGAADVSVAGLEDVPNIVRLGPRPFDRLPAYAARFDVGIIPFLVNDLTRSVNPIKLREMLAAGCPVVSTALPEVAPYAAPGFAGVDAVAVAHSEQDFVERVRERLAHPLPPGDRRKISDAVRGESWSARAEAFSEIAAETAKQAK